MSILKVLLLLSALVAANACSEKEGSQQRTSPVTVPADVGPPVEISLTDLPEEVVTLIEPLTQQAIAEPAVGSHRGVLGMAYEANGFPQAALDSYRQAEDLDPGEARWSFYMSLIQAGRGGHLQAVDSVSRAIRIDESYGSLWMWRGVWLLDLGQSEKALADFRRAESLGLKAAGQAGRARALLHEHKADEALAILEPLARNAPYPSVFTLLGRAYRETGNIDQARIALARGDSTAPLSWQDPWVSEKREYEVGFQADALRAQRYLKSGKHQQAIALFKQLHEQQPNNAVIINRLSRAHAEAGEGEKAFWVLRRALTREPVHYSVHMNIAPFYQARGDLKSALDHLNQAITTNPAAAMPYTRKGLLLQQQRKYREALGEFKLALDRSPGDPNAFFYVGDVEILLKNWPEGIRRFEQSVQVNPAFTLGYLNLGLALANTNRFEEANVALAQARSLGTHDDDVDAALEHVARLQERSE